MSDAIASVLNGANGLVLGLAAIAVIVMLVLSGRLHVNTGKLKLGAADTEREILRRQSEWLMTFCESRVTALAVFASNHTGSPVLKDNSYHARYVCEKMYDECLTWALWNHITDTPEYLKMKQKVTWQLLMTLDPEPVFAGEEFHRELDDWTRQVIEGLLQIRRLYT